MLTSLLVGAALVCAMPLCAPVNLGNGVMYFPCTGRVFGETWEAYFEANQDRVMEGTFTLHYDDGRLVGYSMQTTRYTYTPCTKFEYDCTALFLNYDERM